MATPTADQAAWLWAGLGPWVRWLTHRYPTQLRDLPPCWHIHGDAVEELTALWASWMSAYHGPDQPRDDMTYWHDRWFPAATGRLLGPTGTLINCAKAKQHRDPTSPAHHATISTTPACPPSRNTQQRMCPPGPPPASRSNRALGPKAKREIRSSPEREARRSHPIAPATSRDPGSGNAPSLAGE